MELSKRKKNSGESSERGKRTKLVETSSRERPIVISDSSDDDVDAATGTGCLVHVQVDVLCFLDDIIRQHVEEAPTPIPVSVRTRQEEEESEEEQEQEQEEEARDLKGKEKVVSEDVGDEEEREEEEDNGDGSSDSQNLDQMNEELLEESNLVNVKISCTHFFSLKKNRGYFCCICGIAWEDIGSKTNVQSNMACPSEPGSSRGATRVADVPEHGSSGAGTWVHPTLLHYVKPWHVRGLDFLYRNLVVEGPGGCVMAQASFYEKTFMLICFIYGFLSKFPEAKPLLVLPKSVVRMWKMEFHVWKPDATTQLLDFYSENSVGRTQHLEILKRWVSEKSILFLGHGQFSRMVTGGGRNARDSGLCRDILLSQPWVIVLDKGYNSKMREMRSVMNAFTRVKTPLKVILTGSIYQNHLKDVFVDLNAVKPDFLERNESTRMIKRKLGQEMKASAAGSRAKTPQLDAIDETLKKEEGRTTWVGAVKEMRVLTDGLVYYHAEDFPTDILPEMEDFIVVLRPDPVQIREIKAAENRHENSSKKSSVVSAITLHPVLSAFSQMHASEEEIDRVLENIDTRIGVKTRFFIDLINFCESKKEKLLVLGQYLTPLKFLQRLALKTKHWEEGRETVMLKGNMNHGERENSIHKFNYSAAAKICFGSIKACDEETSLVAASRILILDVQNENPCLDREAIEMVHRKGQGRKVYVYRLLTTCSSELEELKLSTRRDSITKIWFEGKDNCIDRGGYLRLEYESPEESSDGFLSGLTLMKDIVAIFKRVSGCGSCLGSSGRRSAMAGLAEHSSSSAARTMRTTSSLVLHGKRRPKNVICATPSELAKRPDPFFSPYPPDGFEDKYGRFANDIREIIELKRKINGDAFSFLLSYGKNKSTIEENMAKEPPITIFDSDDELSEIVASVSDSATNRNAKVVDRGNRVKLEFGDDLIFLGELHYNEAKSSQNRGLEQSEVDEEVILVDENDSEDSERDRNCSDEIESPQNDEEDDDDADSDSDDGNPQVGDGLDHIWSQMAFELESSKPAVENPWGKPREEEKVEDCEHSFIYKEDIGEVCRVCGLVRIPVESIIEVMFNKPKRSRTYVHDPKNFKNGETTDPLSSRSSREDSLATVLSVHPMHQKQMRPHQIHGFNFLCDNLVSDSPGGCILAHTPGSGKTFLLISFIQSFMAMHPHAKPLIVLPKGVIETWKKEFIRWAVETFPLLDFYSEKADSRAQQLIVLRKWIKQRSILFLGYQQFSSIICDFKNNDASEECQRILLKEPTLLILDEGHTSRNDETDVLNSLDRVETPRKVVLTGTLFQNHVKEVFNILNLVRPKFLRLPESQVFVRRIMSKIEPLSGKRNSPSFCAGVEETLKNRNKSSAKASVIKDLREMTRSVLHYHKADFSDELPGLIDFTVMLNLSAKQRDEVKKLEKEHNFKQMSAGAALYIHPKLKAFSDRYLSHGGDRAWGFDNDKIDEMLQNIDVQEGVKLKFFLNILNLCETRSEKLLVFSQFVFPLKTLERLLRETKGWHLGKEMFTLTGESSNEQRQWSIERFNTSGEAKVFFGSIKACGEGVSLVGASRVLILDVHLNPSVTQQAVARAYRPGQKKKVYAYRLVAADSAEEGDYKRCSEKEFISKMWFEWNVGWGHGDFEFRAVEVDNCDDDFLETPRLREDIKALYIR